MKLEKEEGEGERRRGTAAADNGISMTTTETKRNVLPDRPFIVEVS
jgi:hypothetical protein